MINVNPSQRYTAEQYLQEWYYLFIYLLHLNTQYSVKINF
jgi:hypothetical protein